MQKLKPSTSYDFTQDDMAFVLELAKVGHVHLLSNQVSLICVRESCAGGPFLSFKDHRNDDEDCLGLEMPEDWYLEYVGANDRELKMTFRVKH